MVLIRLVRIASNSHLGIQILPLYQIMQLTTHHVEETGAMGPLQEVILHTPELHKKITFCNCLYLSPETTLCTID